MAVTAVALVLHRLKRAASPASREASKPRWFGRGIFLLAAVQVAAALLSIRSAWLPPGLQPALSLISEHWAIPWSILIAVSLAQIHFADLVLKRSLWLLATVSVSALACVFVFNTPPGLPMLAATLGCAALILSAPYLIRAVHVLVDRVFLGRADYVVAAKRFEEAILRLQDPRQLFDSALQTVQSTLRVDARFVPASEGTGPPASLLASLPIEPASSPRLRLDVSASAVVRRAPWATQKIEEVGGSNTTSSGRTSSSRSGGQAS